MRRAELPAAVGWAIALLQGAVLFGLHRAIESHSWPATVPELLAPAYLLASLLPATALLFLRQLHQRATAWMLGVLSLVLLGLGWHFGARVLPENPFGGLPRSDAAVFSSLLPLLVLWLLALAFVRVRLEAGCWRAGYPTLFRAAWKNCLALLEAAAFTGIAWLLLALCAALFAAIGIRFFRELFAEPAFFYPATTLAFAIALRLVEDVDQMVEVVLAQVLNVLKWLAPLAGLIVTGFALALLPRLPALLASGQKAIGAAALLWLVALTLLLLNAAFQDGRAPRPYGPRLSAAMRVVPLAMVVLAATALVSVLARIESRGLTLERYWALFVAVAAVAYALAYAAAAVRPARGAGWLSALGTFNPALALALAAALVLALTPVTSPYRLSAASQQARARATTDGERQLDALRVLAFGSGRYGRHALDVLAASAVATPGGAIRQDSLARRAAAVREARTPYLGDGTVAIDRDAWLANLRVHPAARPLPPELLDLLRREVPPPPPAMARVPPFALWLDLLPEPGEELLLLAVRGRFEVYARQGTRWRRAQGGALLGREPEAAALASALADEDFGTQAASLPDLRIGRQRLRLEADAEGGAISVPPAPPPRGPERLPAP